MSSLSTLATYYIKKMKNKCKTDDWYDMLIEDNTNP